jgi:hypothetical protein
MAMQSSGGGGPVLGILGCENIIERKIILYIILPEIDAEAVSWHQALEAAPAVYV